MIREVFNNIIQKTLKFTKEFYGDNLVSFVVYGSVGRGCMNYFSDIDILIVAEKLPKYRLDRVSQFDKVEKKVEKYIKAAEKHNIYTRISSIFKTKDEVIRGSPIFLDMIDDGIILYDKNNFFASYLDTLKEKLKKLGAQKIKKGLSWYWILKPDYKPGEKFEIF